MISMVVTMVVMLILASVTIATFNGQTETIDKANDAKIYAELEQLQDEIDKYKVERYSSRNLRNGDFSGQATNDQLVYDGIIKEYSGIEINKKNIVSATENDQTKTNRKIGIISVSVLGSKLKTEIESTLGNGISKYFEAGNPVNEINVETGKSNLIEFSDVFAIDVEDNTLYYVNDGKIWKLVR